MTVMMAPGQAGNELSAKSSPATRSAPASARSPVSASVAKCGPLDAPARGRAPRYARKVIERELTAMAELEAIVADYLQQALMWDTIPALGPCSLLAELQERAR